MSTYDEFEFGSILSEQSSMSDAQDMFGKNDEEVKHFNDILPLEDLERLLNLPACAFTGGTDVLTQLNTDYQKYEKGSLESLWIDQNIGNLRFGTNYDFNYALMGNGTTKQLSVSSNEDIQSEKEANFSTSLNSPETSTGNSGDSWHLKVTSSSEDIHSPEATNLSGIRGNKSDGIDQTEIILPADFSKTPIVTGWISEYQIKIEAENDSPELSYKTHKNIKVQATAESEKLVAGENCCSVCTMPAVFTTCRNNKEQNEGIDCISNFQRN